MKIGFKTMTSVAALCAALAVPAFAAVPAGMTKGGLFDFYDGNTDYSSVEIKYGLTQVKVEAITADGMKIESVYAVEEGDVLRLISEDEETADAEDLAASGVSVKSITEDFEDEGEDDGEDDDGEDDDSEDDDSEDDDSSDDSDDSSDDSSDDGSDDSSDDGSDD